MTLTETKQMWNELKWIHGIQDWEFDFDQSVSRFGICYSDSKRITMSTKLVLLNDEDEVRNTMLHEIAHALAKPKDYHNENWQRIAQSIGCNGNRCYGSEVVQPKAKYKAKCTNCNKVILRNQRRNIACGKCCRQYNKGKYTLDYKLVYTPNR